MAQTDNNSILRKLQLTELEILTELDRLCRKHNLRYYIVGGTLIGAVRHGGFIPWDDDIDVSMPRKDFKKLLKISKTELSQGYFLQTHKTERKCPFHYMKLRKNGTFFDEEKFSHKLFHKGIFMDIFPLDFIPENKLLQKLIFGSFGLFSGLIASKDKTDEYLFKDRSAVLTLPLKVLRFILPLWLMQGLRSLVAKISNLLSNKKLLASLSGFHGYPKEISPQEWWAQGCEVEFEGKKVMAPSDYQTLLTHMFGNYMELPPEEERITHNVDFEKIIFEGATYEDYAPRVTKKRKGSYYITEPKTQ